MDLTRREPLKLFGSTTGLLALGGCNALRWTREEAIAASGPDAVAFYARASSIPRRATPPASTSRADRHD
jgi:hypothetical protein